MINKYFKLHIKEANSYRKKNMGTVIFKRILIAMVLILVLGFLVSCSSTPIVDSRGKSSANIKGDMNRYHDDLATCKSIVEDNTSYIWDKGKAFYNLMRFKVLWLSPKAKTRTDLLYNCLEGRGYNVINK
tara:strand:+ start:224 stop:613 length:390 start_codon:yes stop_codon:yes gene_type:complete